MHTPGPWTIVQDSPHNRTVRYSIGARLPTDMATYVCTIKQPAGLITDGRHDANARLIAAAPDLLEALKALMANVKFRRYILAGNITDFARAAIEKATR